jgi:hypothetical protein
MAELAVYSSLLILMCVFDIRSMIKKSLKKEIIPYLLLVIMAAAVGLTILPYSYQKGIVSYLLDLFKVQR